MTENNEETENEMMKDNNISNHEEHKNEPANQSESELLQSNKEDLNENPENNKSNEQNEINKLDLSEKEEKDENDENEHSIEKEQEQEEDQNENDNDNESKIQDEEHNDNIEDNDENQGNEINHNYNISSNETDNSSQIRDPQILKYKENLIKMSSPQIRNEKYNSLKKFEYTFKKKLNENKLKSGHSDDKSEELRKLEETVELTEIEQRKYLELYNTEEIEEELSKLKLEKKDYKLYNPNFSKTIYSDKNAFKVFFDKMHKEEEIIRKGGDVKSPSFNLIHSTKKYRIVPNPIGVVKKRGEISKLNLKNRGVGDTYVRCLTESLEVSDHITELNLSKNRLSDIGIIPLLKGIQKNRNMVKKLKSLNLSFNRIGIAASELLCQFISDEDCILEYLNLENNHLCNNNIRKICQAITDNIFQKLKYLNIAHNDLDDNVSLDISKLISKCEILNVLILYQNQFRNQGAGNMMAEIKKHKKLKILDMSWNLIGTNLTDELPNLEELTSATKDPNNHFNNAYLNELIVSTQFHKQGALSSVKSNKVSYFATQLCELFHNKSTELLHLDISYNNINYIDSKSISENIKDNHTILGIHVDGNNMWVDELGFVYPIEKNKYEQNYFANSQIFYRISEENALIKSGAINTKKLRNKNNCWICEGWREVKFNYKPIKQEENIDEAMATLHLNFENYKSFSMKLFHNNFSCYRMCPPGSLYFFIAINGIPVDNYGPITEEIKEAIIYTQEKKPKEFIDDESDDENEEQKQFIITKVAKTEVEINPEVISLNDGNYLKMIKHCVPRPEKKLNLKKRPRTPWSFPISIWAWYGYDYDGEKESTYNSAFEYDYERCRFSKDKDLNDSQDEENLRYCLRQNYKKVVETYKNLSAYLGWKIWQIGQNQITEFAQNCPDLLDGKYLINDVLVKVTEVKSNPTDKQEKKQNKNIPDNIIRHQFLMLLVKVAKDKYYRTKQLPTVSESVEYAFENNYKSYINAFDNHKWRIERYYNEEVDNILKAYIPVFDALFYTYAPQQIMSRKDSFWMQLDNFTNLCSLLMDVDFPVKEIPILFSLSMRLQTNEIDSDKHYNMVLPEFLEAFCRFVDRLSPIPYGEDSSKWDMKRRQEQPLDAKIETMIPKIIKLIDGPKKYVKDQFTMPLRDEDSGYLIINYDNPLYEGLLPPRTKKKAKGS